MEGQGLSFSLSDAAAPCPASLEDLNTLCARGLTTAVAVCGDGSDSGLWEGEGVVLRELRVVPWPGPTLLPRVTWGESLFSGPQPPHLSNGTLSTQPCSWGSEVSKAWKGREGLSPDGRGCRLVTCYMFGSLPVPKPTFSVPFFGVGESQTTSPPGPLRPALFPD